MGKSSTPSHAAMKPHRPTTRERRSAGAAVARTVAAMAKPTKLAIEVKPSGGSESFIVPKALRGGDRVMSGPVKRFQPLLPDEEEQQAHLGADTDAVAADADAAVAAAAAAAGVAA